MNSFMRLKSGYGKAPLPFLEEKKFSSQEKLLLMYLSGFGDDICPSAQSLMKVLSIDDRNTLKRYLKRLRTAGLLSWINVKSPHQKGLTTHYYIHWPPAPHLGTAETIEADSEVL